MAIQFTKDDLEVLHDGSFTASYDLDPANITGDVQVDLQNAELLKFQPGVFVTINNKGFAEVADGATAHFAKAVRVSATRGFYTNAPAVASGKVTAIGAPAVIKTVQITTTDIKPGDNLYLGTGGEAGMLTKTKGSSTLLVGVALTANSANDRTVTVELI